MKYYKILSLFMPLFCVIPSYCMEENYKEGRSSYEEKAPKLELKEYGLEDLSNKFGDEKINAECILPAELRYSIIATMLEENINRWDDIFKFDRNSLKEILNKITLVSKDFVVLGKEELKKFIRKLKQKRFAYLKEEIKNRYKGISKQKLNGKLINLLMSKENKINLKESVRLILAGANIDVKNYNDQTALMRATLFGHLEIVKLLINEGADINIRDLYGHTALMEAAYGEETKIVRLLIDKDADIDIKNSFGSTALMMAARQGQTEIVRLLIDKGADIDIKSRGGRTALMQATCKGHTEIVELLSKKNEGFFAFSCTVQ